jgi:hypothetical protein
MRPSKNRTLEQCVSKSLSRGGEVATRRAHNPKIGSSNLSSATSKAGLAQQVEQRTCNAKVNSSIPLTGTSFKCSYRLSVRTSGFHPGKRGSIPRSCTKNAKVVELVDTLVLEASA